MLNLQFLIYELLKWKQLIAMSSNLLDKKNKIKGMLKSNIAKAWYQLDKKSYESWLEGRRISKSELKF